MKQKFKNKLLMAWHDEFFKKFARDMTIDGEAFMSPELTKSSLDDFLKTHTLHKRGDRISQGPNRSSRRKMWKSIPRKKRHSWLEDFWKYKELRPNNKPVRWEVAAR